jgi:hypothetical protein
LEGTVTSRDNDSVSCEQVRTRDRERALASTAIAQECTSQSYQSCSFLPSTTQATDGEQAEEEKQLPGHECP